VRDKIINYILNNHIINDYFKKVQVDLRGDFQSHIWLIIMEMIQDKEKYITIQKLYESGDLGRFITGIITNQLKSNTSSFTKLYKDQYVIYNEDIPDKADEYEEETHPRKIVMKIINELNHIHYADAVLFKLYYGICPVTNNIIKPKTYAEIQDLIGINYQTVRNSVIKTKKQIKAIKL
jgi:hypothetical protein